MDYIWSNSTINVLITVKHFSRISLVKNREIEYPREFSLPIKGLVRSLTLGKCQIKMQRNFYIPKS